MKRLMLVIVIVILCLLYCNCKKEITAKKSWSLIANVLREESLGNQVLLLHEDKFNKEEISQFGKKIVITIPTRIADFENDTEEDRQKILLPEQRFQTTTVVVILSQNDYGKSSKLCKLMTSIAKLSNPKSRPKVLIVTQVTKRIKYENFFKFLWSEQFLDVTILERQFQDGCKQKFAKCFQTEMVYLHNYNPFSGRFYETALLKNSILYPNKLRDLSGYKINVFYFNYPPYAEIKRNFYGDVIGIYGPDANLVNTYSNVMNFTIRKIIGKSSNWMQVKCNDNAFINAFTGIDFLAIQSGLIKTCLDDYIDTSKGTRMISYVFLVPILAVEMKIETEWNFTKLMIIVFLMVMPWLLSRFLKFDRRYWKFMYTIALVIGFSTPQVPRRKIERLIFMLIWVFYFLCASFIFTTLSSLQWQKVMFKEIETLDDIIAANLTPILHGNIPPNTEQFEKLAKYGIYSTESFDKCAEILIDYQNVTCWGREDSARLIVKKYRNASNGTKVKILRALSNLLSSILFLMGGSPYKRRFESITSRLIESGISDMWDAAYIPKESLMPSQADLFEQESLLSSEAFYLMIYFLLIGYLGSFIAFAAEIFIHKISNSQSLRYGS